MPHFRPAAPAASLLIAATVAACHGMQPPDPGPPTPFAPLVSPALPGGPEGATVSWEVVLPYPPEVAAKLHERWAGRGVLRDLPPTVVYLNFEGATINVALDSDAATNTSWVPQVSGSTVTIPAFNASPWSADGTRQQVVDTFVRRMEQLFSGYDISFTTTRPSSGNYMMTVIGGSAANIGMEYGVLGVSPLDCAAGEELNLNPNDVNFICTVDLANFDMNLWDLVYTTAHENAHTYGLAHINRQADIMYYATAGGAALTWGAGATRSGEQNCSNNNFQNDPPYLTKALGGTGTSGETTPPTVSITSPAAGQTLTASPIAVKVRANDASGIAKVEVYVDDARASSLTTSPYDFSILGVGPGDHTLVAKAYDWFNNVGTSASVAFAMAGTPPPPGCRAAADCGTGRLCQDATCVDAPPPPARGNLGSDCDSNEDCASGVCVQDAQNYCTQPCGEAAGVDCPAGYQCQDSFCFASGPFPPSATGWPCAVNTDCRDHICARDSETGGFCTETCKRGSTSCPGAAACVDTGDGFTFVCARPSGGAPPPTDGGAGAGAADGDDRGCGVAPAPARGAARAFGLLAVLLLLESRPRRRV